MRSLVLALCALSMSGCAVGAATSAYSLRAKTASELTSEAEDRVVQKSVKATVEYLSTHQLIKNAPAPEIESKGTSGIERGM